MATTLGRRYYPRILIFSLIFAIMYLAIPYVQEINTYIIYRIFSIETSASTYGNIVTIPYKTTFISADITAECSGILSAAIILFMILIPDVGLKNKLIGICLAIPLTLAVNILRIFLILFVGVTTDIYLIPLMHILSQALLFFWIMLIWTIYLFIIVKKPKWKYDTA